MSEMIERVARAIKSKVPQGYGMTDAEAEEYARAAIGAMRDIPADMIGVRWGFGVSDWNQVIETALSEPTIHLSPEQLRATQAEMNRHMATLYATRPPDPIDDAVVMKKSLTPKASANFRFIMAAGIGCWGAGLIALAITGGFGLSIPSEFLACSFVAATVFFGWAAAADSFWP